MNPYVIFLDIDGTVIHKGKVSQEDRLAIKKAQQAGHQVWINTGRSYVYVPPILKEELGLDGVVAGLGADIRMGDTQLYSKILPMSLLDWICDFLQEYCYLLEGEDAMYQNGTNFPGESQPISSGVPFSKQYPHAKISKLCIFDDPPNSIVDEMKKHFCYYAFPAYHELAVKGQNKATGMEWVMNYLNIPMERSIAIGDSLNDLDMLKAAGISVAMGNAPEQVKQVCDYVTASVTEGGVAKAIEHFLFSK